MPKKGRSVQPYQVVSSRPSLFGYGSRSEMNRRQKKLIGVVRRRLPAEATKNITTDPHQNLLGYLKLLIELDRQKQLEDKINGHMP